MYTTKFANFNHLMGDIIMTEEDTLEVLLSDEFDDRTPKKFRNISPDEWARYAFENNKEYYVTYYKDDKPFVTVHHTMLSITLSYYHYSGRLSRYMHIYFGKGYIDNTEKKAPWVPYGNGKLFFKQVDMIGELGSMLLFNSQKKTNNVLWEEFVEEDGKVELVEQWGTADLSRHWFDAPKHYMGYEYLLDYQKLFELLPGKTQKP